DLESWGPPPDDAPRATYARVAKKPGGNFALAGAFRSFDAGDPGPEDTWVRLKVVVLV
ncbi:hypothetical protein CRENBAI_026896, partial [Crenichthys baileyi]